MFLKLSLLAILAISLGIAIYTDSKNGIISNKLILIASSTAAVLDAIYYISFAPTEFTVFASNLIFLLVIAVLFYSYNLWAAGDSKLLILVGLLIPGNVYSAWNGGMFSGFVIIIITFVFAVWYIGVESIVLGIRNKNLFHIQKVKIGLPRIVASYFAMVSVYTLLLWGFSESFPTLSTSYPLLFRGVGFIIILSLIQLRDRIKTKGLIIAAVTSWLAIGILVIVGLFSFQMSTSYQEWIIVFLLILLRVLAEQYNYKTIPVSELKSGQILSAATTIRFSQSRVQGLPAKMTEDLRSRLTAGEVNSVNRWAKSKSGSDYVVIVRKIPFAVFISAGTVLFIILGEIHR